MNRLYYDEDIVEDNLYYVGTIFPTSRNHVHTGKSLKRFIRQVSYAIRFIDKSPVSDFTLFSLEYFVFDLETKEVITYDSF